METGDKAKGTPGCLQEGDDREVSYSRAHMGESPPNPLGGDSGAGPWQGTEAVGKEGSAHPNDPGRSTSTRMKDWKPWMLDHSD